jgi:hypothetical protein
MTMWRRFESVATDISGPPSAEPQVRARRSRRRAWRDGLAAQTVIENNEDTRSYRSFERAIVASFAPRSVVELELIHRLASLLWRLRRASAIETGLFQMQARLQPRYQRQVPVALSGSAMSQIPSQLSGSEQTSFKPDRWCDVPSEAATTRSSFPRRSPAGISNSGTMAQCFLRLFNLDATLLERVGAYEAMLWRQAAQTIWILDAMRRPAPQTRARFRKPSRRFWVGRID